MDRSLPGLPRLTSSTPADRARYEGRTDLNSSASVRRLLRLLLGPVGVLAGTGCAADAPHLLELTQMEPLAVEARDELVLRGEGFSERARGSLSFDGTVYRAGAEPRRVHVVSEAPAQSQKQLELRVNEQLVSDFLGDDAVHHGTFRGTVTLAFAPRTPGAPPITGAFTNAALDLFRDAAPAPGDDVDAAGEMDGAEPPHAKLLTRYGWKVARRDSQLCLEQVADEGEPSPLRRGDCISRFDGVNVFDARDLSPRPAARVAEVLVTRAGLADAQPVTLDVGGLTPRDPAGWRWGLGAGAILATLLLLGRSPLALGLSLLESKLGHGGGRTSSSVKPQSTGATLIGGLLPFLVVSALFAACGLGLVGKVIDYDLLLVYTSAGALLGVAQFEAGGFRKKGWSLWQAMSSLIRGLGVQLTVVVALAAVVFQHASLSLVETASGQGPLPWQYLLFRSVGSYLCGATLIGSVALLGLLRLGPRSERAAPIRLSQVLLDTYLWTLSGLLVTTYLGGWQVPELLTRASGSHPALGLVVFQTKLLLLFGAVSWLRRVLPAVSERTLSPVFWRWLLPASVAGAGLELVWTSGSWPAWLQASSTWALVGGSVVGLAALLNRIAWGRKTRAHALAINPWL